MTSQFPTTSSLITNFFRETFVWKQDSEDMAQIGEYTVEMPNICSSDIDPGTARTVVAIILIFLTKVSIILQIIFILAVQRLRGWQSNFAFTLLYIMSLLSILCHMGMLAGYLQSIFMINSDFLQRITGSNYQASYLSYVITNVYLTIHRLFYTLEPVRAKQILTPAVLKVFLSFVVTFYIAYLIISLSPLAGIYFCTKPIYYAVDEDLKYSYVLQWMNRISNYVIGVNVVACLTMFAFLLISGNVKFSRNREIRMTFQVLLMSSLEFLIFFYWEFLSSSIPHVWYTLITNITNILYFDVLVVPYFTLNRSVQAELKKLFCFLTNKRDINTRLTSVI